MKIVPRMTVLALGCFVLSCGSETPPPREPLPSIGSTPPARPSGPVQTNPPSPYPTPTPPTVTAGTGGSTPGTGGTGGSTRPADSGATDTPPTVAACTTTVAGTGDDGLIDDFNDNNPTVRMADGRAGTWTTHKSGTATVTNQAMEGVPELPTIGGGMANRGLRLRGNAVDPADTYGAEVQVTFSSDPGFCYDASAYDGVQLSIRGLAGTRVFVQLLTASVRAQNAPTPDAPIGGHYRVQVNINSATTFQTVTIPWAMFQPGWGVTPGPMVDPKLVYGLAIVTAPRAATGDAGAGSIGAFDFTIDNVRFIQ
jgi:hypothetical protein